MRTPADNEKSSPPTEEESPAGGYESDAAPAQGQEAQAELHPSADSADPTEGNDIGLWKRSAPPEHRHSRMGVIVASFLAAAIGVGAGSGLTYVLLGDDRSISRSDARIPVTRLPNAPANTAAEVARAILPSMVRIDVRSAFGQTGLGSGVIYREDGYIVTNDHVVRDAQAIEVHLPSGEVLPASVSGTAAPAVDIAVLKIAKKGLSPAALGSAKDLAVGDLAVAIGSPFGLDATVTAGVVSALHRNIALAPGVRFTDAIQTDAPINPGNSGGALASATGQIVGINTAIFGGTGGNVGVGFAIPIDIVRRVADQIIETGRARLAFLGVAGDSLPENGGARIREIVPGGPADKAGLRPDDVIVKLDGTKVGSMDELVALIIQKDVGAKVSIEFRRQGETRSVTAELAAKPEG